MTVEFKGLFADNTVYQAAQAEFTAVDRPAAQVDAGWGLWPAPRLGTALLTKLANVPSTNVVINGKKKNMPVGSTQLFGVAAESTAREDLTLLTTAELQAWAAKNQGARYVILVEACTSTSTGYAGTLVEILNHELSAHAEPYAHFFIAEAARPGSGVLDTEDEQHKRLNTGNPRYRLIGARYVTTYLADDQAPRSRVRMMQDTRANATLPRGV